MNETLIASVLHEARQDAQACRRTHHTHSARLFRLSRPGAIGTLALIPGDSRMSVVWRGSR